MDKSKFSSKGLELKRTLVVSGIALASFVTYKLARAEAPPSNDVPSNNLEADYPNEGEIKTQEVLAGVERGGFGATFDAGDEDYADVEEFADDAQVTGVLDPVNPWGPSVDTGGQVITPVYPPIFTPPEGWIPRGYFYYSGGRYHFYHPGHGGTHIGHWHGGGS